MPPKSRSEKLFEHALRHVTPFSTTLGHPFAIVRQGPGCHNGWPIFSRRFRAWLAGSFYNEHVLYPGARAIDSALTMLAARARSSQFPPCEIFTRIGWQGDPRRPAAVLLHLANAAGELIEITPDSHRIVTLDAYNRAALNQRLDGVETSWFSYLIEPATAPLPHPTDSSEPLLDQLHAVLGIGGPALTRILVWLFAALRPAGPYPVLVLTGPASAGKSVLARALRSLIDPSATPLLPDPSNEHALFAAALHNHVLALDHVEKFRPFVAAAIARLAAGTTFAVYRRNIFDEPESVALARPIVVAAPTVPAAFANNALRVHLDGVRPHHSNQYDLDRAVAAAAPSILGALCTAVSCALRNLASTDAKSPSRFADVHHWTVAASSALGLTIDQIDHALSANALTDAVAALLDLKPEWTGTATELLAALAQVGYPKMASTPRLLSEQLNITPLAMFGITMEKYRDEEHRYIRLTQTPHSCVMNTPSCEITLIK